MLRESLKQSVNEHYMFVVRSASGAILYFAYRAVIAKPAPVFALAWSPFAGGENCRLGPGTRPIYFCF